MKDKKLDLLVGIRCRDEKQFNEFKSYLDLIKSLTGRNNGDIAVRAMQVYYFFLEMKRAML